MLNNWVDFVVVLFLCFQMLRGWRVGFIYQIISLISYLLSLILAFLFHQHLGILINNKIGLNVFLSSILGFLIILVISDYILDEILVYLLRFIPKNVVLSKVNYVFGIIISLFKGFVILYIVISIFITIPIRGVLTSDVTSSFSGQIVNRISDILGVSLKGFISDSYNQTIKFLTIHPDSNESIQLDIPPTSGNLKESYTMEMEMFDLINTERVKNQIPLLSYDTKLAQIAKDHSLSMFEYRYFSHLDNQNRLVSSRANEKGINYSIIGENLAYSPNLITAHEGLMNSPDHRSNILDKTFSRLGIGIIDSKLYGIMVTQVFAD